MSFNLALDKISPLESRCRCISSLFCGFIPTSKLRYMYNIFL